MTTLLELRDIRRSYPSGDGEVEVLKGITLSIAAGEMVAIVGASGSGKSTLMNILGCLDKPTSGTYQVAGVDVAHLSGDELARLRREHFGFIFQRYHLLSHLTAAQNVEVPAIYAGKERRVRLERARDLLSRLGLGERVEYFPSQLSGGQQQRVAIARAIAVRPRVLLLDEPLSALDAQIRHNMVEEIARLHRELPELTILYVTHDQTEALTLADKIGIMKDGSLIAHGETHELYHYPPNRFSAEFLGRANILQATALKDSPEPGLVSVSCGGGLINAFSRGGLHGNNKLLCIRPQHMSLAPRSATSNRLNATLTSVHWQGDLTHLLCDVAGEAVRIVMTHVNPLPRAGDKLALYFEPGDAVLIEVQ